MEMNMDTNISNIIFKLKANTNTKHYFDVKN